MAAAAGAIVIGGTAGSATDAVIDLESLEASFYLMTYDQTPDAHVTKSGCYRLECTIRPMAGHSVRELPYAAIILSVTAVLIVGEIAPSAVFTGPSKQSHTTILVGRCSRPATRPLHTSTLSMPWSQQLESGPTSTCAGGRAHARLTVGMRWAVRARGCGRL